MLAFVLFSAVSALVPSPSATALYGLVDDSAALLQLDTTLIDIADRLTEIDAAYDFLEGRSALNPYNTTVPRRPILRDRKKALRAAEDKIASRLREFWERDR